MISCLGERWLPMATLVSRYGLRWQQERGGIALPSGCNSLVPVSPGQNCAVQRGCKET